MKYTMKNPHYRPHWLCNATLKKIMRQKTGSSRWAYSEWMRRRVEPRLFHADDILAERIKHAVEYQ